LEYCANRGGMNKISIKRYLRFWIYRRGAKTAGAKAIRDENGGRDDGGNLNDWLNRGETNDLGRKGKGGR